MVTTRRGFLSAIGFGTIAAAAAATGIVDIERLLWRPTDRTIIVLPEQPVIQSGRGAIGAAFSIGDVFTIAGNWKLNPRTGKQDPTLGLQRYRITSQISTATINVKMI
jgi:hypothetical protein